MTNIYALLLGFSLLLPAGETIISWNANSESDLGGYKVHIGTISRQYDQIIDVGNRVEFTFTPTTDGIRYYFAVTAYDQSGNESDYSDEVYTPDQIINPPDTTETDPPDTTINNPGDSTIAEEEPRAFNFPNPFISDLQPTTIRYELLIDSPVTIEVYNVNNERIRTLEDETPKSIGIHTDTQWDGRDDTGKLVPQGIYFARIMTSMSVHIIKIAVLRQ